MDLYSLLGLSRTATDAEIERAYRRLARRYHPGVNPGDRVAERAYQQIQEAYRVLTDAERRREYDRGGAAVPHVGTAEVALAFEGFDFSAPAEGPLAATFSELFADVFQQAARDATTSETGADIETDVRISFADAMRGADVPISLTRQIWCPACAGHGQLVRAAVVCPACQGEGQRRWARGHMVFTKSCETCLGQGRLVTQPCRSCRGTGVGTRTEVVTVHVPAGVETGARLAIPGRGHAGAAGAPAGDLYVRVEVADHPFFRRHGRDLHVTVPIAVHEAALGAAIDVPTPSGTTRVHLPRGTASGEQVRLAGLGIPAARPDETAGDLVLDVQIVLPASLDDRSKELLREFGQRNDITPLRHAVFEQGAPRPQGTAGKRV